MYLKMYHQVLLILFADDLDKIHNMVFSSNRRECETEALLVIGGHNIQRSKATEFFGVTLDEPLLWHDHIQLIKTKVA